jgi:hypothetical protein
LATTSVVPSAEIARPDAFGLTPMPTPLLAWPSAIVALRAHGPVALV